MICVEFQAGRLQLFEAALALAEIGRDILSGHAEEVERMLTDSIELEGDEHDRK